jgi:hypothetical protein
LASDDELVIVNVPEELDDLDKTIIKKYTQQEYHHFPNTIRDIFIDSPKNCIIVALTQKYCPFVDREHKSNNQYVIIDTVSSRQKCHDEACSDKKHEERKLEDYPTELSKIIKKCLRVNKRELELIDKAIEDGKKLQWKITMTLSKPFLLIGKTGFSEALYKITILDALCVALVKNVDFNIKYLTVDIA